MFVIPSFNCSPSSTNFVAVLEFVNRSLGSLGTWIAALIVLLEEQERVEDVGWNMRLEVCKEAISVGLFLSGFSLFVF